MPLALGVRCQFCHSTREEAFLVAYWDQRGCGPAAKKDADCVSWSQQIDDCRRVLTWVHEEANQPVTMLGISIGATLALRAVEHQPVRVNGGSRNRAYEHRGPRTARRAQVHFDPPDVVRSIARNF